MFEYVTESDASRPRSRGAALRRGFAVLLILGGAFSLAAGVTALGLSNLVLGITLGIAELRRRESTR